MLERSKQEQFIIPHIFLASTTRNISWDQLTVEVPKLNSTRISCSMLNNGWFIFNSGKLVGIEISIKIYRIMFIRTHNKKIIMITRIEQFTGK